MIWICNLLLLFPYFAKADSQNIYLYGKIQKPGYVLTEAWMKKNAIEMISADPSFDQKPVRFKGTPLKKIIEQQFKGQNIESIKDVVFIAQDQYITHVSMKDAAQAILAFEINGEPLSPKYGGPFKLVFPSKLGKPANAFCWYVKAIVFGQPENKIQITNNKNKLMKTVNLEANNQDKMELKLPIPVGHRDPQFPKKELTHVLSKRLFKLIHDLVPNAKRVILKTMTGRTKEYDLNDLLSIQLIYQAENEKIAVASGGPFIALAPQENKSKDNLLVDRSVFFLESIQVLQ